MSSKKLVLALFATSALSGAALDLAAQYAARTRLEDLVAAHPGVRVARIAASPLLGGVSLYGIDASADGARVSIGALHLRGPGPGWSLIDSAAASPFDDDQAKPEAAPAAPPAPDPGPPAVIPAPPPPIATAPAAPSGGSATAENIVITRGPTTYHIKRIDLGGTSLTTADLAAMLDQNSPDSLADRLKKLTAASVVIPEIVVDTAGPDGEQHTTERQILLANVVAGRVAAASAAGVSLAIKNPKNVVNGTLGAIEASGLDLAGLVRVFTTKRSNDAEPLAPLMDSFTINGAQFVNISQNSTITIGPIRETGFEGRPLKVDPTTVSSTDPARAQQMTADVLQSFAIGSFETTDFKFVSDDTKDKLNIASITMRDVGHSKLGDMKAGGFVFAGEGSTVTVGSVEIQSLGFPASESKDSTPTAFGRTDINDVAVDITTKPTATSPSPTPIKFAFKHAGFVADEPVPGAPHLGSMILEKLIFDAPPDSDALMLRAMGYTKLDISSGMHSSYVPAAQTLAIKDFNISCVDMGTVHLGLDLSNVSPSLFSSNPALSKVAALALLANGIDLKIENAGLVEKATAWRAAADGITPAQEKAQIVDLATTQIPAILGNGANGKAIATAVGKFIADPKTLHIAATSKTGLGVADAALISTPDVLLDSLEVTATANE